MKGTAMHLFYCPGTDPGGPNRLGPEESHHCEHVLRLKAGDRFQVTDGAGHLYLAELTGTGGRACLFTVLRQEPAAARRGYTLHIAIAPTKSMDRFEWFLEKSVELGIDTITPLLCARSERKRLNGERVRKILVGAMKQSRRTFLPVCHEPVRFADAVARLTAEQRFICTTGAPVTDDLRTRYRPGVSAVFLVGPEGDFTGEETALATGNGVALLSLGAMRLRTETAGVHICSVVNFANG